MQLETVECNTSIVSDTRNFGLHLVAILQSKYFVIPISSTVYNLPSRASSMIKLYLTIYAPPIEN